jgi:hypothetical protein
MSETKNNAWTLSHGIHRGTLTSRDSTSEGGFASKEACEARLQEREEYYNSIGYVIWFANAIAPDGTKHQLRPGNVNY